MWNCFKYSFLCVNGMHIHWLLYVAPAAISLVSDQSSMVGGGNMQVPLWFITLDVHHAISRQACTLIFTLKWRYLTYLARFNEMSKKCVT